MYGCIVKRTVLRKTFLILRLYGVRVWWNALTAPKGSTFLGVYVATVGQIVPE